MGLLFNLVFFCLLGHAQIRKEVGPLKLIGADGAAVMWMRVGVSMPYFWGSVCHVLCESPFIFQNQLSEPQTFKIRNSQTPCGHGRDFLNFGGDKPQGGH